MKQPDNKVHIGNCYKDEHVLKNSKDSICEKYLDPGSKQISKGPPRALIITCMLHKVLKLKAAFST